MRGKKPLMHLENRIFTGCRGKHAPDRERKAVGQKRHDSAKSRRAIHSAPSWEENSISRLAMTPVA